MAAEFEQSRPATATATAAAVAAADVAPAGAVAGSAPLGSDACDSASEAGEDRAPALTPVSFGLPQPPRSSLRPDPFRRPRTVPRDDLLTPRDLARAFQLTYDPPIAGAAPPPPPPAPMVAGPTPRLPRADWLARWNAAVNQHAQRAANIAAVCLMAVAMAASAITFAVAADRAGHAVLAWLSASPLKVQPTQVAAIPPSIAEPAIRAAASPAPIQPAPAATPVDPEPAEVSPSGGEDVRSLWLAALDAESHRQFAAAVKLYDRIQSLPSNCWPASLRTRVALAREELVAGTW